jgi:shikimate kinase
MPASIVLIGPPGAGKTSVGKALAKATTSQFIDTDALIEKDQGKSISEIFVDQGEVFFREVEERVCVDTLANVNGIISLGGGAPLSPKVQNILKESGLHVIFLDVSLAVAAPRIGFNRDRPLLLNNPRQQWQLLMDKRRPIYEDVATDIVEVGQLSVSALCEAILAKVSV